MFVLFERSRQYCGWRVPARLSWSRSRTSAVDISIPSVSQRQRRVPGVSTIPSSPERTTHLRHHPRYQGTGNHDAWGSGPPRAWRCEKQCSELWRRHPARTRLGFVCLPKPAAETPSCRMTAASRARRFSHPSYMAGIKCTSDSSRSGSGTPTIYNGQGAEPSDPGGSQWESRR